MSEVTTIGLDIAKHVFHAHGADERGGTVFSRRLTRGKLLDFFAKHKRCVVALEACGGAHHWARELRTMGHEVRLIPPAYVKPFVKRHKNDAVDAEAICEAAQRPSMRFVAVKSEEQQAAALVFRTRDLAVKQRTQIATDDLVDQISAAMSDSSIERPWVRALERPGRCRHGSVIRTQGERFSTRWRGAEALVAIISIRCHLDHSGGNWVVRARFPDARLHTGAGVRKAVPSFLSRNIEEPRFKLSDPAALDEYKRVILPYLDIMVQSERLLPDVVVSKPRVFECLRLQLVRNAATGGDTIV